MDKLTGTKRFEFFYNQGIRYGAIGYYRLVDEAYDHLKTYAPFWPLEVGKGEGNSDFQMFNLGFQKVKAQVVKIQKMKLVAEDTCKEIAAEFERGNVSKVNHYTELSK